MLLSLEECEVTGWKRSKRNETTSVNTYNVFEFRVFSRPGPTEFWGGKKRKTQNKKLSGRCSMASASRIWKFVKSNLQGCVRYCTGIPGTGMVVVPKLPKCPVPVLMSYRSYRSVRYRYCRTELTEVSGTGNTSGVYRRYAFVRNVPNTPFFS